MIREKIEELRRTLDYHNHKYYVENSPEISDREFDVLMRELQELEAAGADRIATTVQDLRYILEE